MNMRDDRWVLELVRNGSLQRLLVLAVNLRFSGLLMGVLAMLLVEGWIARVGIGVWLAVYVAQWVGLRAQCQLLLNKLEGR